MRKEEEKFFKALGRHVRLLRRAQRLTQSELAERAGLGDKYIGEIERGCTNPTARLLWRIGRALGVPMWELFLFSLADGDEDSRRRIDLFQRLKERAGKDLAKVERVLQALDE